MSRDANLATRPVHLPLAGSTHQIGVLRHHRITRNDEHLYPVRRQTYNGSIGGARDAKSKNFNLSDVCVHVCFGYYWNHHAFLYTSLHSYGQWHDHWDFWRLY